MREKTIPMKEVLHHSANVDTNDVFHESLNKEFTRTIIDLKIVEDGISTESDNDEKSSNSNSVISSESMLNFFQIPFTKTITVLNSTLNTKSCGVIFLKSLSAFLIVSLVAVGLVAIIGQSPAQMKLLKHTILREGTEALIKYNENSLPIQINDIPVLLELPETSGAMPISTALSKCLDLKSGKFNARSVVFHEENSIDFYLETSLCKLQEPDNRLRMFIVFDNPAVRIFEDYYKIKAAKYDRKVSEMDMGQYLDWPATEDNSLIRSILCKTEGKITEEDFNKAKNFLKEKAFVGVSSKYASIVEMFQKKFKPNLEEPTVAKCIQNQFRETLKQARHLDDDYSAYIKQMFQLNIFDFRIYEDFFNG